MFRIDKSLTVTYSIHKILFVLFFLLGFPLILMSLLVFWWSLFLINGGNVSSLRIFLILELTFIIPAIFLFWFPFLYKVQITPKQIRKRFLFRFKYINLYDILSANLIEGKKREKDRIILYLRGGEYLLNIALLSFRDRYEILHFLNQIGNININRSDNYVSNMQKVEYEKSTHRIFITCLNCNRKVKNYSSLFTRGGYCSFRCAIEYKPLNKFGAGLLFIVFGILLLIFLPGVNVTTRHSRTEGIPASLFFVLSGLLIALLVIIGVILKKYHPIKRTAENKVLKREKILKKILDQYLVQI